MTLPSPIHPVDRSSNFETVALESASRTASGQSEDISVPVGSRLAAFLDVSAASGTGPTLDVTVKAKDPASGKYFTIGTFAQVTAADTQEALFIGGGSDAEFPTSTIRVEWSIGGTSPDLTFSVGLAVVS